MLQEKPFRLVKSLVGGFRTSSVSTANQHIVATMAELWTEEREDHLIGLFEEQSRLNIDK